MIIYIDNDYKCHVKNDGTMRTVETDTFSGKCREWIESYRFVPSGETWVRSDGMAFAGEMKSPWKDMAGAEAAQRQYDEDNEIVGILTGEVEIDDEA